MVRFIVNICYEILHSLRARLTLSVQNDNIKVVVLMKGRDSSLRSEWQRNRMRFFAALRMTKKKSAQNDKKGCSEWHQKNARNDNKTTNCHLERSERSRFWWLGWLLIYVMLWDSSLTARKRLTMSVQNDNITGRDSSLCSEWQHNRMRFFAVLRMTT